MKKNLIDLFFLDLAKKTKEPTEVIITGAVAGALFGHLRQSVDIDFEIRPKQRRKRAASAYLDGVIREISSRREVATNYGEDIGHWSMIDFLDYRKKSVPYKKMGHLDIRVIAPEHWTIGKMCRFLEIDVEDMVHVIKKKNLPAGRLIKLWARALKASSLSPAKKDFIDHVRSFIKTYGKRSWGKSFDAESSIRKFNKHLGLTRINDG